MSELPSKYARLALDTSSRRFELARGKQLTSLERRLRALERAVPALNLESDNVHLASEIAALQPDLSEDDRYALIVLIVISLAAQAQGSTRFPIRPEQPMRELLRTLTEDESERDSIVKAIAQLLKIDGAPLVIGRSEDSSCPLLHLDPFICHQRLRMLELSLADKVSSILRRNLGHARNRDQESKIDKAIADVTARPVMVGGGAIEQSAEQQNAVRAAVGSQLALVSGGPGTGKTSIVVAILRVLARLGIEARDIALCAPTGRAAFRMRESVEVALANLPAPSSEDEALRIASIGSATIHRMLGYSEERRTFFHHRNNPLSSLVVIVDEASMIDLALMERLLGALHPEATIIILGDADQLPSVSAGAAFRDLLPTDKDHPLSGSAVRLTHNYRTQPGRGGSASIVEVCAQINRGEIPKLPVSPNADALRFEGVELLNSAPGEDFLDRWDRAHENPETEALLNREYSLAEELPQADRACLAQLFAELTSHRILCATRIGAELMNASMHRRAAARIGQRYAAGAIFPGEPVMVLRNIYGLGLFNGDLGVIVNSRDADGRPAPAIAFQRGKDFAIYRMSTLRDAIELSYATTVHKAQGSEFDTVALVLPERDIPLLTRELIYTAVSRCRIAATIIGSPEVLAAGIARKADRFSGISDDLRSRFKPQSRSPKQLDLF